MSQMLKSSGAMGAATLTSRVLGLVREIVYAHFMGDTAVASAFKLAFLIPNLFRRLLGEGALTAAFIPLFAEKQRLEGPQSMWGLANAVISGLAVAAAAIIAMAILGVSLALAFLRVEPETQLMLELVRLMFPYMFFVCLAAIFMGMLNALGYFFIPALGAAMLNLVMIAAVFFLVPLMGPDLKTQIFGLAFGVLIAGVIQAGFQLPPLIRQGFTYRWVRPWGNAAVQLVTRRMVPGMIGVAAFQLNLLLTQGIAFAVDKTIIASFDYAVRLMEFPQGVFAISLATYLLPALSGLAAEKNYPEFRSTLQQGINYLIFINLLASVLLILLAEPIVRLLFERGKFDSGSTARVSFALALLAPGLLAFSLVNILARAFYALGDTATPMRISALALGINVILVLFFVHLFTPGYRQGGLGLANSISSAINVSLLLYALRRKMPRFSFQELRQPILRMTAAVVMGGAAAWLLLWVWEFRWGHHTLPLKVGAVFIPMIGAAFIYGLLCVGWRVPAAKDMLALLFHRTTCQKERD